MAAAHPRAGDLSNCGRSVKCARVICDTKGGPLSDMFLLSEARISPFCPLSHAFRSRRGFPLSQGGPHQSPSPQSPSSGYDPSLILGIAGIHANGASVISGDRARACDPKSPAPQISAKPLRNRLKRRKTGLPRVASGSVPGRRCPFRFHSDTTLFVIVTVPRAAISQGCDWLRRENPL